MVETMRDLYAALAERRKEAELDREFKAMLRRMADAEESVNQAVIGNPWRVKR